jgi:isoquinoline 1-oxidoreductase beta subunit
VPESPRLKDPSQFRLIGRPAHRVDSAAKVTGRAVFSLDTTAPGMLVALVARSPSFGGKVKSFDAGRALAMPGVKAVVQVPSGVAVVAERFWQARQARAALAIDWDAGPGGALDSSELAAHYATLGGQPGAVARRDGDPEAALAGAARRLEAQYDVPFLAHAPMEPLSCLVTLTAGGAEVVTGSQFLGVDRLAAAQVLGLAPEQVTLRNTYLGGGFGRRANTHSDFVVEAAAVAKAARHLGAPIKTVWTREDDLRGGFYRPMWHNALAAGLDADGNLVAWRHRLVGQSIVKGTAFEGFLVRDGIDATSVEGAATLPYAIPNLGVELHTVDLPVPVQWWRSVGHSNTGFATECFLDEVAAAAGRDPVALRRALLAGHPRHLRVLDLVAEKAGWGKPLPAGVARGVAVHESFRSFVAQVAEVSLEPQSGRPRVHRVVCAIDCGPVINPDTVRAQMEGGIVFALSAALHGEISLEAGRVKQSNFHDYPLVRMHEAPAIEVHIAASRDEMGGTGEPGVPPLAPAVANALFALTGQPQRRLPIGTVQA